MKTAITITVRLKSTRLEKKAIKKICEKTLIEHLIERLKKSQLTNEIILCTSKNSQDDPLIEIAKKNKISFFRGSEIDVLDRLYNAALQNNVDFIVSCTGDNPLTDPEYIDKIIEKFQETDADYITALDLPWGTFSYGVKVSAIKKIMELKEEEDTEVWGQYFNRSNLFKTEKIEIKNNHKRPDLRLTVDTDKDFELIEKIYSNLYKKNKNFYLTDIIEFLDNNPDIKQINQEIKQKIPNLINPEKILNTNQSFMIKQQIIEEIFSQLEINNKLSTIYSENPKIIFLNFPANYKGEEEIHPNEEDLYFVVEGSAKLYEEDTGIRTIEKGDIIHIPKNKKHKLEYSKEGIKYIVFKIKNDKNNQ